MTQQQIEERRALMGLLGQTYVQMKEIDGHIAAAGSNAKFAGRSEDLKRQFQEIATAPILPAAPAPAIEYVAAPSPAQPVFYEQPQPPPLPTPPVVMQQPQAEQLEFNFSKADKNILQDIYNVLFDIKKILLENREQQKKAPKKKLTQCCICGTDAVLAKSEDMYYVKCKGCVAETSKTANSKDCIKEWNDSNK